MEFVSISSNFEKKIKTFAKFYIFIIAISGSAAEEISCENYSHDHWINFETLITCTVNETTVISDPQVTFAEVDKTIGVLWFVENKNISHLPVEVDEKLPNLVVYAATGCSITSISNVHFKGLVKLEGVYLGGNQIGVIGNDIFKGLKSLRIIDLCKNIFKHFTIFLKFSFLQPPIISFLWISTFSKI